MKNKRISFHTNKLSFALAVTILLNIPYLKSQEFEFIVQHEGETSAIGFYENDYGYVYFNSGGNIHILKKSTDDEFTMVNSFHSGCSWCDDITFSSDYMFLSSFNTGIKIYSLTDPEHPKFISLAGDIRPLPRYCIISDTTLISCVENYAVLYNIADVYHPEYLTYINYDENRQCTYTLSKEILYGFYQDGYSGPQSLLGYDISDPASPVLASEFLLCSNWEAPWPDAMDSNDDNLFVAFNDTVKIYNISDTDTIVYETQFRVPGEIQNLKLPDSIIYISVKDSGVFIFNVSNIFEPALIGYYHQPNTFDCITVSEDYIISGLDNKGLRIANKTDLQNIQDVYEYTLTDAAFAMHFDNNMAYITMLEAGLQVIDMSDILNPVKYGRLQMPNLIDRIESIPGFLYCMKEYDSVIHIVNVTNPSLPVIVGEIVAEQNKIYDYCIDNNLLFLMDSINLMKVLDLTTPENPELLFTENVQSRKLAVQEPYLVLCDVITDEDSAKGLRIRLYKTTINNILLQDEIVIEGGWNYTPFKLILDGHFIYVQLRAGVMVLSFQWGTLNVCDEIVFGSNSDFSYDLEFDNSYLFLTGYFNDSSQILIIDKTDPNNLVIKQSIPKGGNYLALFGQLLGFTMQYFGYYFYGDYHVDAEDNTNLLNESYFQCYPNPCKGCLTICIENEENSNLKIELFDINGHSLFEFTDANINIFSINTDELTPGIYFVRVSTTCFSEIKKFVVTN